MSTIKTITTFKTADGKKFDSQLEAEGHEQSLAMKVAIDAFILVRALRPAEATRARNYISGFAAFSKDNAAPEGPVEQAAANDSELAAA